MKGPPGTSNNFGVDKQAVTEGPVPSKGLEHLHGLEEGCTAMQLLLDMCLGEAPWRTYHLSEPPGKTMTGEMKGSPDKGAWPISVYL